MPRHGSIFVGGLLWLSTLCGIVFAVDDALTDPYLLLPPGIRPDGNTPPPSSDLSDLEFTLRRIYHHGTHQHPNLHRYLDIPENAQLKVRDEVGYNTEHLPQKLRARTASTNIQRLVDRSPSTIEKLLDHATTHGQAASLPASAWTVDQVVGPDVSNKSTIIALAWMAANAYVEEPYTGDWRDVGEGFNNTDDFGWEDDGLRGHIYATKDNSTVVIGLKGTSTAFFDGPETTGHDKLNDNLFGSCCCAQGGDSFWKQVCDCMTSQFTCNNTCLVHELRRKSHYYHASRDLYQNVTALYPNSQIWLSGHSLGGVLAALIGLTYGEPAVTFEAYPDAMAANRLGLPTPPGYQIGVHQSRPDLAVHHIGHTADIIFSGQCHGFPSSCSTWGYAFEGACHTGKKCVYDTVNDKSWRMGIGYHPILTVIKTVLEEYDKVPSCSAQLDCTDCYKWKFYESNGTEKTSTSVATSTRTRTRTETCKTPGWWGCLDETTTTTSSTTTSTSTSSTSTCETPGWFGCKDPTTTTSSMTTTRPPACPGPTITTIFTTTTVTPSSSTCSTPGWFGRCKDATTTAAPTPQPTSSFPTYSSTTPTQTKCTSRRWFWFGCADPTTTTPVSMPSSSNLPTGRRKHCVERHWYGLCKEWEFESSYPKSDL